MKKKKVWIWWLVAALVLGLGVAAYFFFFGGETAGQPILTIETPQKVSAGEVVTLDVTINDLGDALYPAMSMSIRFDSSRLEFSGIREGNVFVYDDGNASGRKLPEWSCNVESSNQNGLINIMYLDMTGGKYAFSRELLEETDNVVLRLEFRVRGSARPGDVLELSLEDAVFAASDETRSLAMTTGTLKTRNSRIVVGE